MLLMNNVELPVKFYSKRKKELSKMQKEHEEDKRRFTEIQNKMMILANQKNEVDQIIDKTTKELND